MWVLPLRCGDLENVGVYSSGFPRGKKNQQEELTHIIMQAERCRSLPSWRPRTVGDIIWSDSTVLRTRGVDGVSPSLRVGEGEMSQLNQRDKRKRGQIPPSSIFLLFRLSGDWTMSSVLVHLGSCTIEWVTYNNRNLLLTVQEAGS